ncbi:MAG: 30S ribosomal protein S24e [Methanomicrobium sp.]|jgi:small subunit ribosomal protein S24e|nr:30S ribosomal protein S24e [Methanomicrobium sp.]
MDFEFTIDKENKLLNRTELGFVLKYEGATPSRKEIMGKLCALRNVNPAYCVVDSLESEFGKQEIVASARIYQSEEELKATELDYIIKRCHPEEKSEEAEA